MDLLEVTFSDDKSDIAENYRASCLATLLDPEVKAKIWQEISDMDSEDSLCMLQAKMNAFYWNDEELTAAYEENFFDLLY